MSSPSCRLSPSGDFAGNGVSAVESCRSTGVGGAHGPIYLLAWTLSIGPPRPQRTLYGITEFSEHESNGRELDEGERVAGDRFSSPSLASRRQRLSQADGAFDHLTTPGLDDEGTSPDRIA